jgi:hypothetical protein
MVLGPDGVPTCSIATNRLPGGPAGQEGHRGRAFRGDRGGARSATKLLATGGSTSWSTPRTPWRWRPADTKGKGTLARIRVAEAATWGADILGIGTYVRNADDGLYNLYVLDPSEQQILRYSPAQDGSGYPAAGSGYLTTPQDVSRVTSIYIDGEVYLRTADRRAVRGGTEW